MLEQLSVAEVRTGKPIAEGAHVAVVMCYYPRGLRRELRSEYLRCLAPSPALFKDWQRAAREHGHDEAFRVSRYEERFELAEEAWRHLRRLSGLARTRRVALVCQCAPGERCHRELLLLLAEKEYGAAIGPVHHSYATALARLSPRPSSSGGALSPR